jgi:TonB family protein
MRFRVVLLLVALSHFAAAAQIREYRLTHDELKTQVIYAPMPEYPLEAQRRLFGGQGYYRLNVAHDGNVTAVKVIESAGNEILDVACLNAFKRWRWKPGFRREIDLPVSFTFSRISGSYSPPTYVEPGKHRPAIVREFRD